MPSLHTLLETHRPWPDDRRAIYDVLAGWFAEDVNDALPELPDEDHVNGATSGLRWAAGARDGVTTHHTAHTDDEPAIAELYDALTALVAEPTPERLDAFYTLASTHRAIAVADGLLRRLVTRGDAPSPDAIYALANWLATCAPDREPVKLGIALLGLFDEVADLEPLVVLAHHDELTLFAAVALLRLLDEPVEVLFSLARQVRGWGRVHLVERLVQLDGALEHPGLRAWLLREGFRNDVLDAYLALICAEAGDLAGALAGEPDDELVDAARDLIATLCDVHGPAGDLRHYLDGAVVVERLLGHLERRAPRLADLSAVLDLHALVLDDELAAELERVDWTPRIRRRVTARCVAFVQQPVWYPLIDARLAPDIELATFQQAAELGARLGMDTWPAAWARLGESGEDALWWRVTRTDDAERMAQVVDLAERTLPRTELATGPEDRTAAPRGAELTLMVVLQALEPWPGLGAGLVATALRAPIVGLRNRALGVLDHWGRQAWPASVVAAVEQALAEEPNGEVRARLEALLSE